MITTLFYLYKLQIWTIEIHYIVSVVLNNFFNFIIYLNLINFFKIFVGSYEDFIKWSRESDICRILWRLHQMIKMDSAEDNEKKSHEDLESKYKGMI
jgi:hypothetical protein